MRFLLCALPLFFLGLVAAQTYTLTTLNGTCSGASGVSADPRSGTLYAGCSTSNSIMSWSSATAVGTVLLAGGTCVYPEDLWFNDARGSLFVACNGYPSSLSTVVQITQVNSTTTVSVLPATYSGCSLHYVLVDVDNSVHASCDSSGVLKWTDTTKSAVKLSDGGLCLYSRQMAINPVTGDLFLACLGTNNVLRWAPGNTVATNFYSCNSAQGVVIANNGDLYAGCGGDNKVVKFAFNAASHTYSTFAQQLNGTCSGSGGLNLQWASSGLFATCVSENTLKFWSLSALSTNSLPTTLDHPGTGGANLEVTTYAETILNSNFNTGKVLNWRLQ